MNINEMTRLVGPGEQRGQGAQGLKGSGPEEPRRLRAKAHRRWGARGLSALGFGLLMLPLSASYLLSSPALRPCAPSLSSGLRPPFVPPHSSSFRSSRARGLSICRAEASDRDSDLNWLQTELIRKIEAEDYAEAAIIRDKIAALTKGSEKQGSGWPGVGAPEWLSDRAERMGYTLPLMVQRNAMKSVLSGKDTVVRSPTGSGKTLSYLIPMLTQLSDDLLDEDISLYLSRFTNQEATKGQTISKTLGDELPPTPMAVVVVPTRELGVQVAMQCYQLLGGQRNNPAILPERIPSQYVPGNKMNMFSYKGPRRTKVFGVWDDNSLNASMPIEDYGLDSLKGVHIVVGTPKYLKVLAERGHVGFENSRFVIVDEADECMQDMESMDSILKACEGKYASNGKPRTRIFVGASLQIGQVKTAEEKKWLDQPVMVGEMSPEAKEGDFDTSRRVPPSLKHQYVQCEEWRSLGVLAKLMRQEIERYEEQGGVPPRVIIYAKDVQEAVKVASPVQSALWTGLGGSYDLGLLGTSVLLPNGEDSVQFADDNVTVLTYESSIRVMELFLANQTNVLVTTPLATRGLDFPGVTHVYNLGLVGTAADYQHRAGRVGRIGQANEAVIVSIVQEEGVEKLKKLGEHLQFEADEIEAPAVEEGEVTDESSTDTKVRFLEDIFQLFSPDSKEEDSGPTDSK